MKINIELRDYFAGQALVGMLAHSQRSANMSKADRAAISYEYAEAMMKAKENSVKRIAAREKQPTGE